MTTSTIRKALDNAGLKTRKENGIGKCGVGLSLGNVNVLEEKVKNYSKRHYTTVKTGRIVVAVYGSKLSEVIAALKQAGISCKTETVNPNGFSTNIPTNEYVVIA